MFKDRLKEARRSKGLTQVRLAEMLGVHGQSISDWERGVSHPEELRVLTDLASILDRSTDWLLDDRAKDAPPIRASRSLRVKGYVGATGEAHYFDVGEQDLDEIRAWADDPPGAVAVQIRGKSLGRLLDRWYAVYDDVRRPFSDDLIGRMCVVGLDDGRVLIKEIQRIGNDLELVSNTEKEPRIRVRMDQVQWAARVTSIRAR